MRNYWIGLVLAAVSIGAQAHGEWGYITPEQQRWYDQHQRHHAQQYWAWQQLQAAGYGSDYEQPTYRRPPAATIGIYGSVPIAGGRMGFSVPIMPGR